MFNLIIGILASAGFFFLIEYSRKNGISIRWWQWLLTAFGILYVAFVLEVITGFLSEGEPRAALVMGLIMGIVAVIWGVLTARFVFKKE